MLHHTELCNTFFKFTLSGTKLWFHSSVMSHQCGLGLDPSDVWRTFFVWAQVDSTKYTSNIWSDPTRSTSMWHHTGVKPQLCLSQGEFKQSSQTSDGTQPSPHRCYITLRCVILCLNSPALGQSCGFSQVGCQSMWTWLGPIRCLTYIVFFIHLGPKCQFM